MNTIFIVLSGFFGLLVVVGAVIFLYKKAKVQEPMIKTEIQLHTEELAIQTVPSRIVIGDSVSKPLLTIEAIQPNSGYVKSKRLDITSGPISRLSGMLQAVPSLLVAAEASTKSLYEVVINGDMVRAADGNGLRAMTLDSAGKIQEHAKVFEVKNLQNMINAAAVWQVASVVVAQKHLADISQKLDEIKQGVQGITRFLDNQRKSRIHATYDYMGQAYQAIQNGELPSSVRNQLEDCERDLIEIQHHLHSEYRQKLEQKVEHKETFGSKDLANDIGVKINELNELAHDMAFCLKTRIVAWHVLSLYPGEPQLKLARRASIQESVETFEELGAHFSVNIDNEISNIKATFTRESVLVERREALYQKSLSGIRKLREKIESNKVTIEQSAQAMLTHDSPTHFVFEYESGVLVGATQRY
jgi:hypothetical protein